MASIPALINGTQTITGIDTVNDTVTFSTTGTATTGGCKQRHGRRRHRNHPAAADFDRFRRQPQPDRRQIQRRFRSDGRVPLPSSSCITARSSLRLTPPTPALTAISTSQPLPPIPAASSTGINTAVGGKDAQFFANGLIQRHRPPEQYGDRSYQRRYLQFNGRIQYRQRHGHGASPSTSSPIRRTVQNSIVNFVTAYNAIQTFAAAQTQLNSDGTYASTAILANNQTFRQTMTDINQEITSQVSGLSSSGRQPGFVRHYAHHAARRHRQRGQYDTAGQQYSHRQRRRTFLGTGQQLSGRGECIRARHDVE